MVNFTLSILAFGLAATVAAIPTTLSSRVPEFTFAQWVEDIIADPTGDHLSPIEAVAAKNAAVAANPLRLDKRASCDPPSWPRANANDASTCLGFLAQVGNAGTTCSVGQNVFAQQFWRVNNAEIYGSKSNSAYEGANCADVARTGGLIFDSCWRSDGTIVGSQICTTNSQLQVGILGA